MANFYKMVVKAVSTLVEARRIEADEIMYVSDYPKDKIDEMLHKLNEDYFKRIDDMLQDAADIAAKAKKDRSFD